MHKGRVEALSEYVGKCEIKLGNPAVNLGLKSIQMKITFLAANSLKLGMTLDVRILPQEK